MAETPGDVERELRELGRAIDTSPPSPRLTTAVMRRVAAEPAPARSGLGIALERVGDWSRARLRWVLCVLLALVGAGVAVSPVGAEVVELLRIGGVVVRTDPDAPRGTPDVPRASADLTLAEASDRAGFEPLVPRQLGPPEALEVGRDPGLISMSWQVDGVGAVRLDQFAARLAPYFWKTVPDATPVRVGSAEGLWVGAPHEVVLLDGDEAEVTAQPRLAAQTLIWVGPGLTFRLEGDLSRQRALDIAASVS